MKAGRIVLISIAVILVVAGIGSFVLVKGLDKMTAEALEEAGDQLMKSGVSIDSAKVGIAGGSVTLSGFAVQNPEGFSNAPVLSVGSIMVDVDLGTLNDEVLVVEHIEIIDPRVRYEINAEGVSNMDVLEHKLQKELSGHRRSDEKILIVDHLEFVGGTITAVAATQPGKELVFDFPQLTMREIGRPDGIPADRAGNEVAEILMDQIMDAARQAGIEQFAEAQKARARDKLKDKLEEKLGDLLDRDGQ